MKQSRWLALCTLLLAPALVAASAAQDPGPAEPPVTTLTYTLRYQSAAEAVSLIYPHLSERGAVELRPGGNVLVIRDSAAALERILPLLRDFDHPVRSLLLEIQIVSAGSESVAEADDGSGLSPELVERLRRLLRYRSYRLVAGSRFRVSEGREVASPLGREYRVEFRLGTLQADRRIKLHSFRVLRGAEPEAPKPLIHTNLNLWLDRPMVLGLARTEASERALMIVLNCTQPQEPSP